MSDWEKMLRNVTEDYLIGLTNKGIVKRAVKDLDQTEFGLKEEENSLTVHLEEVTCTLVSPLGESKCSCPSRSMCKHIVMSVLYAKKLYATGTGTGMEDRSGNAIEPADKERPEENNQQAEEKEKAEEKKELLFPSIWNYPLNKIKRTLGEKRFLELYSSFNQGSIPDITVGSIITVVFPDRGITVRLLEPAEYSTCSCHKKELCRHKAEAILLYQLYSGKLAGQELKPENESKDALHMEEAKEFSILLKDFLGGQLATGLARSSTAVMDSLERLAILSHNQKLPDFERRIRELDTEYKLYFKRDASFQVNNLLYRLCSLYRKAEELMQVQTTAELEEIAGDFRTEYVFCPVLKLTAMGQREFISKTGYEGETYYFISEETMEWYTYTNARPVFYENGKRKIPSEKSKAPWQLPCNLEELAEAVIVLYNGKVSKDHRLSATSEAKAEYLGKRSLKKAKIMKQYYEDFLLLFQEHLADSWRQETASNERLVLLQPAYVKNASFDTIKQEYSMELYDKDNRRIILEVPYSKKEYYTIRFLERLAKRIDQGDVKLPCFFGSIFIKEDTMRLYPINYYEDLE